MAKSTAEPGYTAEKEPDHYEVARQYVVDSIASFKADPAATDFQRGYLAALRRVLKEAFIQKVRRRKQKVH